MLPPTRTGAAGGGGGGGGGGASFRPPTMPPVTPPTTPPSTPPTAPRLCSMPVSALISLGASTGAAFGFTSIPGLGAAPAAPKPVMDVNPNAAPVEAPKEIKAETGIEQSRGAVGGVEGGVVGGVTGGIVGGLAEAPPPPPPPPPPPAPGRGGGNIKQPTKVKDVRPVYPAIAQSARVQGVVIIEATIGPHGAVQEAKVLRSIPLLAAAALDAVRQWQFTPTLLNGVPVPVIMTVTVNFTLQ